MIKIIVFKFALYITLKKEEKPFNKYTIDY